jgi:hypothetical protein
MAPNEQNPFIGLVDLENRLQRFARQFVPVVEGVKLAAENFGLILKGLSELQRQSTLISKAGFVPHPTMPQNLLRQSSDDPMRLSELLVQYYEDNWPKARDEMLGRANNYQIDNEAKVAFNEALIAHENGLYRSVVRTLFPEIERVARNDLYRGALGSISVQHGFAQLVNKLAFPDLDPAGFFGLTQLNRLREHLYIRVTKENRKKIEADAVPNRHAAIHGIVVYSTAKNSLNTIFMTDYIYQVVNAVKVRYAAPQPKARG